MFSLFSCLCIYIPMWLQGKGSSLLLFPAPSSPASSFIASKRAKRSHMCGKTKLLKCRTVNTVDIFPTVLGLSEVEFDITFIYLCSVAKQCHHLSPLQWFLPKSSNDVIVPGLKELFLTMGSRPILGSRSPTSGMTLESLGSV